MTRKTENEKNQTTHLIHSQIKYGHHITRSNFTVKSKKVFVPINTSMAKSNYPELI